jgi:altronate dehydratase
VLTNALLLSILPAAGAKETRPDMNDQNTEAATDPRLLLLSDNDNVGVAIVALEAGERLLVRGETVETTMSVPLGHKIAIRSIAAGEKVVKYGAPIGSATQAIGPGDYVHTHNLKSDYLPTYTLDDGHRFLEST